MGDPVRPGWQLGCRRDTAEYVGAWGTDDPCPEGARRQPSPPAPRASSACAARAPGRALGARSRRRSERSSAAPRPSAPGSRAPSGVALQVAVERCAFDAYASAARSRSRAAVSVSSCWRRCLSELSPVLRRSGGSRCGRHAAGMARRGRQVPAFFDPVGESRCRRPSTSGASFWSRVLVLIPAPLLRVPATASPGAVRRCLVAVCALRLQEAPGSAGR